MFGLLKKLLNKLDVVVSASSLAVFILGVSLVGSDFACCVELIAMKEPKVIKTARRLGDRR